MKTAVIVEDELLAANHLIHLLDEIQPQLKIATVLQSVNECINYFSKEPDVDIVFMDIHLTDGLAFHVFEKIEITCPIIFTTAYDKYALEAFKVNSIDYLMKPIKQNDLGRALQKIEKLTLKQNITSESITHILSLIKNQNPQYKTNFLIPYGDKLVPLAVKNIACFYIDTKITHAITFDGNNLALDQSLDDIMKRLDPEKFYRANRQYIISIDAIQDIHMWLGGKLFIKLNIKSMDKIIIPKAKIAHFKSWYTK